MLRMIGTMRSLFFFVAFLVAVPWVAGAQRPDTTARDWKRGGVCYEIFVRSFYDSDGDGIGDLNGVTQKLDYINDGNPRSKRDLGADCIWLMPVAESPSYHGYDVSDYYRVERDYGTNDDFKRLVAEAHRRGIKVLVDMVLNHASSEHPFFQEALRDTASPYRDWFRWSATKPDQKGPWGQEVWHHSPVRDEYYYGIFWSGMPDLNYENPAVREEAKKVARFWLEEMGVDGFRLDAVPYLVEEGDRLAGHAGHARDAPRVRVVHSEHRAQGVHRRRSVGQRRRDAARTIPTSSTRTSPSSCPTRSSTPRDRIREDALSGIHASSALPRPRPVVSLFAQSRSDADAHRAWRRCASRQGRRHAVADASRASLRVLRRGDRHDRQQAGRASANADAMERRSGSRVHEGQTLGSGAAGFAHGKRRVGGRRSGSLLNRYRELIHLRASNPALASGELVPLSSSNSGVIAYLRRTDDRTVLVVANLGDAWHDGLILFSPSPVLPAGRYAAKRLLGPSSPLSLRVGADGRISGYMPIGSIAPMETYVFELTPPR